MSRLLKSREVQELFGIAKSTLQSWKKRGILAPRKIGGLDFYDADELEILTRGGSNVGEGSVLSDADQGRRI